MAKPGLLLGHRGTPKKREFGRKPGVFFWWSCIYKMRGYHHTWANKSSPRVPAPRQPGETIQLMSGAVFWSKGRRGFWIITQLQLSSFFPSTRKEKNGCLELYRPAPSGGICEKAKVVLVLSQGTSYTEPTQARASLVPSSFPPPNPVLPSCPRVSCAIVSSHTIMPFPPIFDSVGEKQHREQNLRSLSATLN